MLKIDKPIIVEGKYDKIKLENIVDALIIKTDGYRIFKNAEKRQLIRRLANQFGIIVLTDSDNAGRVIRGHIKSIAPDAEIINVDLPEICGKEKRKKHAGAQGLVGVEGTPDEIILNALKKYCGKGDGTAKVTNSDFYNVGFTGRQNSAYLRKEFCKFVDLPQSMSTNELLDVVNRLYGRENFTEVAGKWLQEHTKN